MALRLASAEVNAVWALVQIQLAAPDAHPFRGAARIAGHLAAKVPDAAALHPFTLSEKLHAYWECCLYFVSNWIVQIYDR